MKKYYVIFALVVLSWACAEKKQHKDRPIEHWVFRSVLDQRPRMVTMALHDNLWMAYDAQSAAMYKAWKGGVKFDGAVYTTVHGPQPTSEGYAYYVNENDADKWVLIKGGQLTDAGVRYHGHKFDNGKVAVNFELITPEGDKIKVTETPEYKGNGNQAGMIRMFEVQNATDYQVGLKTRITSLKQESDYKTDGEFEVKDTQKKEYPEGTLTTVSGLLKLNPKETSLTVYFHPGFDDLAKHTVAQKQEDTDEPEVPKGASLIENSDCKACHNAEVKTVGPAYISIARKYNDTDPTISALAAKVIKGGGGVWGEAMMTPHPDLMEDDAKEMVKYILSLDDNEQTAFDKNTLGVKSVPIALKEKYTGNAGAGLMAHFYVNHDNQPLEEIEAARKPSMQGVVSRVHALTETDFSGGPTNFALVLKGYITIEKEDSYDFRLISDDGSYLYINNELVIDNGGPHGPRPRDGEFYLKPGKHKIKILYQQGGGGAFLSFQWFNKKAEQFELVDDKVLSFDKNDVQETQPYVPAGKIAKGIPGDALPLDAVHPAFDLFQARPNGFKPKVGGIDFLSDGRMVVTSWEGHGPVYLVENWQSGDTTAMTVKQIAFGLAEPLGVKVVNDQIYVLQKQELTKLIDHDGDDIIDEYKTHSYGWRVSANFHEFAFGLVYKEGYFYATLATAILPGGASARPQIPDRGKVVKISEKDGSTEFVAHGLRTPNGIGLGVDNEIFVADNQGDWLPASKIVHIKEGEFYGSRSVDPEGTKDLQEKLPVAWLPQDEIGNSPSTPIYIDKGPYKDQMIHGEVTNGGIKRVFVEKVNGSYQGSLFRFTQGLEAGVNRILWAPDGSLIVGGVGSSGNWGHSGKLKYGLQRLVYNEKSVFEMLKVSVRSNGFVVEFTEPIADGQNVSASDFEVKQWYYKPTIEYGGPKLGVEDLKVKSFHLSEDRKSIFFELPGIKPNHMVYFRIVRPFKSELDHELWSTEAWYTLNEIPSNKPGFTTAYKPKHNTLTAEEKAAGWQLLFDGKSTKGLRNFKKQTIGKKWQVQNGTLHFLGKGAGAGWQAKDGGDIIVTPKPYKNYEFYVEWKLKHGGNSGIIYNVIESDKYDYVWQTGPELQILDNERHPDGQIYKHRAGDLYDLIATKYITVNEPMQWNRVLLRVKDGHVEHWQNGYKVVEYDLWTDDWKEMVAASKFKDMPDFGTAKEGHIALQDHGDEIWFRNIKIRELK